ncbi:MAG: hypothetical protein AAB868_02055 [Patescibacteria group bacterium]
MAKIIGNKNLKKEATINDLVVVVNNLSERMDKGFSKVDKRFKEQDISINNRFDEVDNRFKKIDNRFDEVNDRFTEQEIKLEKMMDEKIEGLAVMVNKSFESVEKKLENMATKDELNLLRQDMDKKFDKVNNSIEKISIKMDNLADVVYADHRLRIISLENRTQKLEASR